MLNAFIVCPGENSIFSCLDTISAVYPPHDASTSNIIYFASNRHKQQVQRCMYYT